MKLGIFSVSMPVYEPGEVLDILADIGYDGVQWRVAYDDGDRSKPEFWCGNRAGMNPQELLDRADELNAKAGKLGLEMASLGASANTADLEETELYFKAAAAIGAKNVRVGIGTYDIGGESYYSQIDKARVRLGGAVKLAEKYGIKASLETHPNHLTPSAFKAMNVLKDFDPKHVGIIWDPANQFTEGGETFDMAIDCMGEYLAEIHAKNNLPPTGEMLGGKVDWRRRPCAIDEGQLDWAVIVSKLKKAGFDGWIFFEDFSVEEPLLDRLRRYEPWFRGLINSA